MAIHPPPLSKPPCPEPMVESAPAVDWRRRLRRRRLRLWAWWICRRQPGAHPVAELIARGEWAALDRLLADLDEER